MTESAKQIFDDLFVTLDSVLDRNREVPAIEYLVSLMACLMEHTRVMGERSGNLSATLEYMDNTWQTMLDSVLKDSRDK